MLVLKFDKTQGFRPMSTAQLIASLSESADRHLAELVELATNPQR